MIRVGTDKRKLHSAEQLLSALVTLMDKKDFSEITVSDLQKESGVSRATFYRLFDNPQDVLDYKCRSLAVEIAEKYSRLSEDKKESFLLFTLRYWLEQHAFLEAVFKCGRGDILQNALFENYDFLRSNFHFESIIPIEMMDYLDSASMGILSSILLTWVKHGKKETAEELIEIFRGFGELMPLLLK